MKNKNSENTPDPDPDPLGRKASFKKKLPLYTGIVIAILVVGSILVSLCSGIYHFSKIACMDKTEQTYTIMEAKYEPHTGSDGKSVTEYYFILKDREGNESVKVVEKDEFRLKRNKKTYKEKGFSKKELDAREKLATKSGISMLVFFIGFVLFVSLVPTKVYDQNTNTTRII